MTSLPELKSRKSSSPLAKIDLLYNNLPDIGNGMCTSPPRAKYEEQVKDMMELQRLERLVKQQEERLRIRVDWAASGGRQRSAVDEKLREYEKATADVERAHESREKKQREMLLKRSVLEEEKMARSAILEKMNDCDAQKRERLRLERRARDELRSKQEHERGLASLDVSELERRKNIAQLTETMKRQKRQQEEQELEELEIKLRRILDKCQQRQKLSSQQQHPSDSSAFGNIKLLIKSLDEQESESLSKLLRCEELSELRSYLDSVEQPGNHIQLKHLRDCISTSRLADSVNASDARFPKNPFLSALISCANPVLHPMTRELKLCIPTDTVWPYNLSDKLWPTPRDPPPLPRKPNSDIVCDKWPYIRPPPVPALVYIDNNSTTSVLSINWPCNLQIRGKCWNSASHFFHAMKYSGTKWEEQIRLSTNAEVASYTCERVIRSDWGKVKVSIMRDALSLKFEQNADFASCLLATGNKKLIVLGNDTYWCTARSGRGTNQMGVLLMDLRDNYNTRSLKT
eukprot:TRINITY_DN27383_c0_g1_i1.p1 TRINITY_DN27383_c0_g1~~TRINITY_DN27383_c0_g1_i1.p1  ORF type:complete len:517 (+),score=72.34 TRINITY_DN27383_c0_g1_i1:128-1678(+)